MKSKLVNSVFGKVRIIRKPPIRTKTNKKGKIMLEQKITTKILNNDIDLDYECWACQVKNLQDNNGICSYCRGIGFLPTKTGQDILDLIKRYLLKN